MQPSELLLADLTFLLGWYVLAGVITLIELEFWQKEPGKSLPDIKPWSVSGLFGILLSPFLHRSWKHLRGNTIPFFVLGGLILLRHPLDLIAVTLLISLVGGLLIWLFGGVFEIQGNRIVNFSYAGLSLVTFGYRGFLLTLFFFDQTIASAIVLGLTILLFGRGLRTLLPSGDKNDTTAWEAHLLGFIVGALAAAYLPELRPLSIALLQALDVPTQFNGIAIAGTVIDERFYRQTLPPLIAQYGPPLLNRLRIVLQLVAAAWIISFIDFEIFKGALHSTLGTRPWTLRGLIGIPLSPLLHGNWEHLAINTLPFLVFGSLIVLVKPDDFLLITIAITLIAGVIEFFTAAPGIYYGASGLVFGYIGFLLSLYYFEDSLVALLLLVGTLLLIVLIDMIWKRVSFLDILLLRKPSFIRNMFPTTLYAPWSHFIGFVSGVIVAGYLPSFRSYAAYLLRTFN